MPATRSCALCHEILASVVAARDNLAGDAHVSRTAWPCNVGSVIADHVTQLVYQSGHDDDRAASSLDRLRQSVHADAALLWIVAHGRAIATLRAGRTQAHRSARLVPVDRREMAIERLRRNGLVLCGVGEVSGVEDFVPGGVSSFVAAGANRDDALASVLVLGWKTPRPPCGPGPFAALRIAAALLERALSISSRSTAVSMDPDVLAAASDRLAIIDRDGALERWTAGQHDNGATPESRRPANALERCQRAAQDGSVEAALAWRGVEAVGRGAGKYFQTVIRLPDAGRERVTVLTATPLPGQRGALVADTDLAPATVAKLADRSADRRFMRLVDAVPLPFWMVTLDGRVTCASRRWLELIGDGAAVSDRPRQWWDRVHPDDRPRAAAAFDAAMGRREGTRIELRLRDSDGSFRASSCSAAPIFAADGTMEGYLGVSVDISAQRRAEAALETLESRLAAAQEAERSRIARELHDDLGQQVVLLGALLDSAAPHRLSRAQLESRVAAARIKLREIATTIHALAHSLHPAKLKLLGLVPTLHALCREVMTDAKQHVDFTATDVPYDLDEAVVLCIYRVAQEALQNVMKHSGGGTVTVRLIATADSLRLRIVDDGKGFDPLVSPSAGLGLLNMRERVELLGGTLTVTTAPTCGTTIEVTVRTSLKTSAAPAV